MNCANGKESVLRVTGATRRFAKRLALSKVDLSLCPGEIFVLLGPNGAGKTTLLRAIAGRLQLDFGSVRINGRDPNVDLEVRRLLGVVPQTIAIYSYMTARENLEVFGVLAGIHRRDLHQAVNEALSWTGLTGRADDRASTLSGGMQRRLNIAASILHHPKVLLLDEPTVGVDPRARKAIHRLLQELRHQGISILITTHDLEQAQELADRIGILVDGQIVAEGNPAELIQATFGNAKDLIVTLSCAPDDRGRALLASEGLLPVQDQKIWTGRLQGELGDLSGLGRRIVAAGLAVVEVRVREPDLRGIFFRFTGEEARA